MPRTDRTTTTEEAVLYLGGALALAACLVALGVAGTSASVGLAGALLVCAGAVVSWHTRHWRLSRAVPLGLALGAAAVAGLGALIAHDIAAEVSGLYAARADPGLGLALRMALLPLALSFVLVRPEAVPFAMVPALAVFGLISGRGQPGQLSLCFAVFLAAGLAAVGHAMVLTGLPPGGGLWAGRRGAEWRRRHWGILAASIAAILALGYALYLPTATYLPQYRWQLISGMGGGGTGVPGRLYRSPDAARSYPIGRGPVSPLETPVMRVTGPAAGYWRGEVFDHYTGRAWLASQEPRLVGPPQENELDLTRYVPAPPGTALVTHRVELEADLPFVIHAPGLPQRVRPEPPLDLTDVPNLLVDAYGCVVAPQYLIRHGAAYTVASAPLDMAPAAPGPPADGHVLPSPSDLPPQYLRVPMSARRVADLARAVAGDEPTALARLSALVQHLQGEYTYSQDVPATPRGRDAADYFLLDLKRGYCDLYATALVLMARSVGIPARLVTGYAGGEYDPETATYLFRGTDAHAWAEVYVLPWGWITADATPAEGPVPLSPLRRLALSAGLFVHRHPWATALAVLVLIAALGLGALRVMHIGRWGALPAARDARAAVARAYAQACHLLGRRGRPRRAAQTPLEFLAALEARPDGIAAALPAVRLLTEVFVIARYGPGPVEEETAASARSLARQVRVALRRGRRQA